MVDDQSVVLEWKLFPSRDSLVSGEDQQAPHPYLPQWISATVHINNPQISYTTKVGPRGPGHTPPPPHTPGGEVMTLSPPIPLQVPVDVQEYNLTHLLPATEYRVCLTISSSLPVAPTPLPSPSSSPNPGSPPPFSSPIHISCVNVTTKDADFSVEAAASRGGGIAAAAVVGSMFALSIMALLVVYISRRAQQHKSCGHSLKKYIQHATSIPLNELYPPLITLWENEAEKDKEEKEDEDGEAAEKGDGDGGSQINTNKTYMW